mgnify:CR=1 FL=1
MISNQSIRRAPANGTFCVFSPAAAHRLLALFATLTFVGGHLSFWKPASLILAVFSSRWVAVLLPRCSSWDAASPAPLCSLWVHRAGV